MLLPIRFEPHSETRYRAQAEKRALVLARLLLLVQALVFPGFVFWTLSWVDSWFGLVSLARLGGAVGFAILFGLTFLRRLPGLPPLRAVHLMCAGAALHAVAAGIILVELPGGVDYGTDGLVFVALGALLLLPSPRAGLLAAAVEGVLLNTVLVVGGLPLFALLNANAFLLPVLVAVLLVSLAGDGLQRRLFRAREALHEARSQASRALEDLAHTRRSLARLEREAALGRLVSGAMQELARPLAREQRLISNLELESAHFRKLVESGTERKSDLWSFVTRSSELTHALRAQSTHASALVEQFVQLVHDLDSGQQRPLALRPFLEDLAGRLALLLEPGQHQLLVECRDEIVAQTDPGALFRVLEILIRNSVQHGFRGRQGGRILVQAAPVSASEVEITLGDDGQGIAPEAREHLFEPYFTTAPASAGTAGLGLSIARDMAMNALGGQLTLIREGGSGGGTAGAAFEEAAGSEPHGAVFLLRLRSTWDETRGRQADAES